MPVTVNVTTQSGEEVALEGEVGQSLMQLALAHDVEGIDGECGGECSCATCHLYIAAEWLDKLPKQEELEDDMLDFVEADRTDESRLSCQIKLSEDLDGLRVTIPE